MANRNYLNTKIPFGKHKGKKLSVVPYKYLQWLQGWEGLHAFPDLEEAIPHALMAHHESTANYSAEELANKMLKGEITAEDAEMMLADSDSRSSCFDY